MALVRLIWLPSLAALSQLFELPRYLVLSGLRSRLFTLID